jgi:hypothetical protein
MVRNNPQMPAGSPMMTSRSRPRRRGGGSFLFFFLLLVLLTGVLAGAGLFVPARLAMAQEQVLGILHGGIVNSLEETYVDGCVPVAGEDGLRAVTRTRRYVVFGDGTTLEVVFSGRPATNNACP